MRTRRPLRPRQSLLHKERTMSALNVTIDPSIKGAWPEARLGCFIYTADVRAREDSLWTCLETRLPRTSKPCWRPRRWPRSPTSTNPGRRTRPSARTPDASAFRPNRCTAGAPGQGPLPDQQRRGRQQPCLARNGFLPRLLRYGPHRCGHRFPSGQGRGGVSGHRQGRHRARKHAPARRPGEARSEAPPATLPAP